MLTMVDTIKKKSNLMMGSWTVGPGILCITKINLGYIYQKNLNPLHIVMCKDSKKELII